MIELKLVEFIHLMKAFLDKILQLLIWHVFFWYMILDFAGINCIM